MKPKVLNQTERIGGLWLCFVFIALTALWTGPALADCSGSGLTYKCSAGSSVADVQSAINNASDGAQITFDPGSYSWGGTITLLNAKGVSLLCANPGSCNITLGSQGSLIYMDTLSGFNTHFYRISGFSFLKIPAGSMPIWIFGSGTLSQFRIDHNTFSYAGGDTITIMLGEVSSKGVFNGVIDHNTFTGAENNMALKILGMGESSPWPASPKGTSNNVFFEDNVLNFTANPNLGLGCVDLWNGASLVYRHNTSTNCLVTSHGVGHGGGAINFEFYDNTLIRTANSGGWEDGTRLFHHQGSGEFIAFNNLFTAVGTKSLDAIGMTHYRSVPPSVASYSTSLGQCNGTSAIDGNRSPTTTFYGYPCWRQPGRDGSGKLQPMYVWNNRWSDTGVKIDMVIENPWGTSSPAVEDHIVSNRDFYNAVSATAQTSTTSPFSGSSGMGFGTVANRPLTCVTNSLETGGGVGYFATDQNTLYRCSTNNVWVAHYKPYIYPHPLVSGSANNPPIAITLKAPMNLRTF